MGYTTYKDLIDHLADYAGGSVSPETERYARRAIQNALLEFPKRRNWSYFYRVCRIHTVAPQATGTIEYDHTGGTYERMVTLTGSTWPSWAASGSLVIDNLSYEVDEVKSSTVLTLTSGLNPGSDIASGTSYTLYQDTFPLPRDLKSVDNLVNRGHSTLLRYQEPSAWLEQQRVYHGPSQPCQYTITGDPNGLGGMAVRLYPIPDQAYQIDGVYQALMRAMRITEYSAGLVTVSSLTVTGSGTQWTSNMVGSVIRFSSSSQQTPTGLGGQNPYQDEARITAVASATSLTIDTAPSNTTTGVKYAISDPLDLEEGAMRTYFLRECEQEMRAVRRIAPVDGELQRHQEAKAAAFDADHRDSSRRWQNQPGRYSQRLADMPTSSDQG